MGVQKTLKKAGDGQSYPQKGDEVTIDYKGYIRNSDGSKGKLFDESKGRGDFVTKIGEGKVIRGWDEGVPSMSLGEEATLDITSDYAYGDRGFPGHIPPNSALIFDVKLKKINDKQATS